MASKGRHQDLLGCNLEQILRKKIVLEVEHVPLSSPRRYFGILELIQGKNPVYNFLVHHEQQPSFTEKGLLPPLQNAEYELQKYHGVNAREWFYEGLHDGLHVFSGRMYYSRVEEINPEHKDYRKYQKLLETAV